MRRRTIPHLLASLTAIGIAIGSAPALATDYEAASTTALGITGDMSLTDTSIAFEDGTELRFSEMIDAPIVYDGTKMPATIYKLATPSNPTFKGSGNDLCGQDVTYIATWADEDGAEPGIILTTYTGATVPTNADEEMCSLYWYVRK